MTGVAVRHRADEGELVGDARQSRQQLAHLHTGDRGSNRIIRPANLGRSFRLQIQTVEMAGSTVLDDENAGSRTRLGLRLSLQKLGQSDPQHSQTAELQEIAAT